jgi:hypothetical protein
MTICGEEGEKMAYDTIPVGAVHGREEKAETRDAQSRVITESPGLESRLLFVAPMMTRGLSSNLA